MARQRTVTHIYSAESGWTKTARRRLTDEYATELRQRGVTMVVARAGLFSRLEISLSNYSAYSRGRRARS